MVLLFVTCDKSESIQESKITSPCSCQRFCRAISHQSERARNIVSLALTATVDNGKRRRCCTHAFVSFLFTFLVFCFLRTCLHCKLKVMVPMPSVVFPASVFCDAGHDILFLQRSKTLTLQVLVVSDFISVHKTMPMFVAQNLPGKELGARDKKLKSLAVAEVRSTPPYYFYFGTRHTCVGWRTLVLKD